MNDFQIYLIAQQRMDQLHAEAMALDHGPGVPRRLADSLRALASVHRTRVRYRGSAAIAAAAVFTVFAVVGSAPAWAQAPAPPSPEESWEMMGVDSEVSPRLQGYLPDNGEFTVSGQLERLAVHGERLALGCQRFAQDRADSC